MRWSLAAVVLTSLVTCAGGSAWAADADIAPAGASGQALHRLQVPSKWAVALGLSGSMAVLAGGRGSPTHPAGMGAGLPAREYWDEANIG